MKRFASHYLFMTDVGFIKQQVVEITDEGSQSHTPKEIGHSVGGHTFYERCY